LAPVIVAFFRGEIGDMFAFRPQEEAKLLGGKGEVKDLVKAVEGASPKKIEAGKSASPKKSKGGKKK
jgi:hypothetical protein